MNYRVIIVPRAKAELTAIITWVSRRSPSGADRLLRRFDEELALLAENADGYGLAPESEMQGRDIRQLFFRTRKGTAYRALFDIEGDTVRILRVRGPGQDLIGSVDD